jgi:hypothetical protein
VTVTVTVHEASPVPPQLDPVSDRSELRTRPAARAWSAPPRWVVYLVLGLVAIGIYYLLPTAGVAQAVLLTVLNGTAAGCAFMTARRTHGRARTVWASLGISMGFLLSRPLSAAAVDMMLVDAVSLPAPKLVLLPGIRPEKRRS